MARKIERELTPNFIKIYFDEEGDAIDAVLSGPQFRTHKLSAKMFLVAEIWCRKFKEFNQKKRG